MRTERKKREQEKSFPREETLQKMLYYFRHLLLYGDWKTALSVVNNEQQINDYIRMLKNLNIVPESGEMGKGASKNVYFGKTKICNLKEQVCRLYSMTSGTMGQLAIVVVVLSLLSEHGELTGSMICEKAGCYGLEKTIAEMLPRMREAGIIIERNEGRTHFYRLGRDIFETIMPLDKEQRRELLSRVEAFWDFTLQAYPYSGILHSVSDVMAINKSYYLDESTEAPRGFRVSKAVDRNEVEDEEGHLIYDNTFFHQVIDEFNVWKAYEAYRKRKWLHIYVYNNTERMANELLLFPIRVVCDMLYGRSYILGYVCKVQTDIQTGVASRYIEEQNNHGNPQYRIIKVSDIGTMRLTDLAVQDDFSEDEINDQLKYAWNVAVLDRPREKIHVHLRFHDDHSTRIRVENQGRHGTIGETKDDWFDYEIDVFDATEMKSWLRTFGRDVIVLEPQELRDILVDDYKAVLGLYEED